MGLKDLFSKAISPVDKIIDQRLNEEVKEKTEVAVATAIRIITENLDVSAPMVGDFLSGQEITLTITHTMKLKLET